MNTIDTFSTNIWKFYKNNKRNFAWRDNYSPYYVVVSEIMLQQTQTYRVEQKFVRFIDAFPTFEALACASFHNILKEWQGLGYNRRARFLQQIAQKVIEEHEGALPNKSEILVTFPGIGKATAGSICAFAFNQPTIFIETNIRTVFLHHFFPDQENIDDAQLFPFIEQSLDKNNPRQWYYALMDYGVYLKKLHNNPSRNSKHYTKQSAFKGSDRQIRGAIIKLLTIHEKINQLDLFAYLADSSHERVQHIIDQLAEEKFITTTNGLFHIAH